MTAAAGDWDGALGALLLFATNVLAIIVVCTVLFWFLGSLRDRPEGVAAGRPIRRWRVAVVVGGATLVVVTALAASTLETVRQAGYEHAASVSAADWADANGEELLSTRYETGALEVVLEGDGPTASDVDALPGQMRGAVPAGTAVVVNRLAGHSETIGKVP